MFLTIRLVIAAIVLSLAAAALGARLSPSVAVASVNAALAFAVLLDVLLAPSAADLRPERRAPNIVGLGDERSLQLRLRNPRRRRLGVEVRDSSPPSVERRPLRHRLVLEPHETRIVEASFRPSRRGWARFGPITLRAVGPLGLAGRQGRVELAAHVKIYPALPGRREVELRLERARMLQAGMRSTAFRGGGTDFDSLREYHPDDEFRRINWTATARASKPITNLYREERNQQVMMLFDAGRTMAASIGEISRFELALDAGFAVAELAARVGDHVGMVAFAGEVLQAIGPRSGRAQPRRMLDLLFDLQPRLEAPDYSGAFSSLLARHRRRSLLVLLTDLTEESAMESLFRAVPSLLARHLVLLGSIVDPVTMELASSMPSDSEGAYLKAAAADSLAVRERAAARLRAMGVQVEDRPPGKLSGALADRYLHIKSTGRL